MRQKIPTLLVIILLTAIIGLGIFIYTNNRNNQKAKLNQLNPQELLVTNISDTSATIIWHTDIPTAGKIIVNNTNYFDDRDQGNPKNERLTHFVTISNLNPETNYNFQIDINGLQYPDNPVSFKTISRALNEKAQQEQTYSPVKGSLLDTKQVAIDEAIIVMKLPNAIPKATFVTSAGNFILPLTKLVTSDLTDTIKITDKQPVTIEARKSSLASLIQITLPVKNQMLAPVTLGKNENLIDFLSQPAGTPQPLEFQQQKLTFDLNNDGKVNTLDSSLITDLIARKQYNQTADFNSDRTIDQKDLELIKAELK